MHVGSTRSHLDEFYPHVQHSRHAAKADSCCSNGAAALARYITARTCIFEIARPDFDRCPSWQYLSKYLHKLSSPPSPPFDPALSALPSSCACFPLTTQHLLFFLRAVHWQISVAVEVESATVMLCSLERWIASK